jgi:hypothetical protein
VVFQVLRHVSRELVAFIKLRHPTIDLQNKAYHFQVMGTCTFVPEVSGPRPDIFNARFLPLPDKGKLYEYDESQTFFLAQSAY